MSSFKRIRFFECDPIEDTVASAQSKQKGRAGGKAEDSKVAEVPGQRTIQDINVLRMIYLDMFFLFLGFDKTNPSG